MQDRRDFCTCYDDEGYDQQEELDESKVIGSKGWEKEKCRIIENMANQCELYVSRSTRQGSGCRGRIRERLGRGGRESGG